MILVFVFKLIAPDSIDLQYPLSVNIHRPISLPADIHSTSTETGLLLPDYLIDSNLRIWIREVKGTEKIVT